MFGEQHWTPGLFSLWYLSCTCWIVALSQYPATPSERLPPAVPMAGAAWTLSSAADLLPASLSLSLLLASLVAILVLGVAAVLFDHLRKIGCMHSLERTSVSDAFFEDPSSLNKVPCPSIFDPAEKYISLIVPAYNEECRLPEALTETFNYLKQRSTADKSFSYEVRRN